MINGYEASKGIGIGIAVILQSSDVSGSDSMPGITSDILSGVKPGSVIVARVLTPAAISMLRDIKPAAIVCETGGLTSHSALVAKSFGIPAVYGAIGATDIIHEGDTVIVDGIRGFVYERPDNSLVEEFTARKREFIKERTDLERFRKMKTKMADGSSAEILCNVGDVVGVMNAIDNGAEGIGLYRTENYFSGMKNAPTEDEQTANYSRVARAMEGFEVVIRTLDIGGDKRLPFMPQEHEENPFLGFRAIRYSLGNKPFFSTQLRAILRSAAYGNVSVLIPMVTCVEEIRELRALIQELCSDMRDEGAVFNDDMKIGVMVETPAAAEISDLLAGECDFFSIGTNDLVQYTMCADRGDGRLSYLQSVTQPPVLRLIERTIKNGLSAGISVSVCGEAASDPEIIPVLAGFGCRRFSVDPLSVPEVRRTLSEWTLKEAEELAMEIMKMPSDHEIRQRLKSALKHGKA